MLQNLQPDILHGSAKLGGRAIAAARHPSSNDEMIVVSESGGLFKTSDRGKHWTQVSGTGTFWFSHVKYLSADPSIVIATAYKDTKKISGGGIWRSSDRGNSWSQINLPANYCNAVEDFSGYCIDIDPASGRIWVGTSCGLIYSDDRGITWTWQIYYSTKIQALIVPSPNRLIISTPHGIATSSDNGNSWSNYSKPSFTINIQFIQNFELGLYNEIAVSPYNANHIFYACKFQTQAGAQSGGLFFSADNGNTWTALLGNVPQWRFAFVKVVPSLQAGANLLDVYYSNGATFHFDHATLTDETQPQIITPWKKMDVTLAHEDVSDMIFETDGRTPLLITNDGGVSKTGDQGNSWIQAGAGSGGFNALQVNDIKGQATAKDPHIYFITQDNYAWASEDNGLTWPHFFGGEGVNLQIPFRKVQSDGRLVTVSTGIFGRYITKNLFNVELGTSAPSFPDCPGFPAMEPTMITPAIFIQNGRSEDRASTQVYTTRDTGATWFQRATFTEAPWNFHKISGGITNPVFYQAIPSGWDNGVTTPPIGIRRLENTFGLGDVVISDVTGFGNIGTFKRTIFNEKIFGVDPGDPNHLIVPDIVDNKVKVTYDGGQSWTVDDKLTALVTQNGQLNFNYSSGSSLSFINGFDHSQITEITFDPMIKGRILVGTMQAGCFWSCDNGSSWNKVEYSEQIPAISGFYFKVDTVFIASYGRGLWRTTVPSCSPFSTFTPERRLPNFPVNYWNGVRYPLAQLRYNDSNLKYGYFFVRDGNITGYKIDNDKRQLTELTISGGSVEGYGADKQNIELPFKVKKALKGTLPGTDSLLEVILKQNKVFVKGIVINNKQLQGLILNDTTLLVSQLPRSQKRQVSLYVDVTALMKTDSAAVKTLHVYGSGFDPKYPVYVTLDGQKNCSMLKTEFDTKGTLVQTILAPSQIGDHTIIIEQFTKDKMIRGVGSFFIPMIQKE